jgi:predicted Zn finger-like uncharacterized protein
MRLTCPACQTEYEVPDAALAGRARTLRCGHCDHQWQVGALDPAPLTPQLVTGMALPEPGPPQAAQQPAMTAERPPTPVSFVPEPPPQAAAKRKFPIPDSPGAETELFDPKSTAKLTYGAAGFEYNKDLPVPRRAKKGANPWLVSILILLIAIVLFWVERFHIMQAWPPSARLFNAITVLLQPLLHHK